MNTIDFWSHFTVECLADINAFQVAQLVNSDEAVGKHVEVVNAFFYRRLVIVIVIAAGDEAHA